MFPPQVLNLDMIAHLQLRQDLSVLIKPLSCLCPKGLKICYNNGSEPMPKWLRENFFQKIQSTHTLLTRGPKICYNNGSEPMQKWHRANCLKHFNANILYFYAHWRILNNICHFVILDKSELTFFIFSFCYIYFQKTYIFITDGQHIYLLTDPV